MAMVPRRRWIESDNRNGAEGAMSKRRRPTSPDLTGQRFGRLEVLSRVGSSKRGPAIWLCRCACLATVKARASDLRRGRVRSCGCIFWEKREHVARFKRYLERMDYHDSLDPQIPAWKFLDLEDHFRDYPSITHPDAISGDTSSAGPPPPPPPELLAALEANLRNALTERERRVLQMRVQADRIGGAYVCRAFTIRGDTMLPGRWLAADEVLNIAPLNRRALLAEGYLKLYPWSPADEPELRYLRARTFEDGVTYEMIAVKLGLGDASHARKIEQGALRKLRKHLSRFRQKLKNAKDSQ